MSSNRSTISPDMSAAQKHSCRFQVFLSGRSVNFQITYPLLKLNCYCSFKQLARGMIIYFARPRKKNYENSQNVSAPRTYPAELLEHLEDINNHNSKKVFFRNSTFSYCRVKLRRTAGEGGGRGKDAKGKAMGQLYKDFFLFCEKCQMTFDHKILYNRT